MLILYSNDYPDHERVVNKFAFFLSQRCHCTVMVDLWSEANITVEKVNWLPRQIELADKVIFIVSRGSIKKAECLISRSRTVHSIQSEKFNQDYFLEGYTRLVYKQPRGTHWNKNVISVAFEYIPSFYSNIPDLSKPYRLLGEMEPFLKDLHDLKRLPNSLLAASMDQLTNSMAPSLPVDVQPSPNDPRVQLVQAIDNMVLFVKAHPRWFEEYHGFVDFDEQSIKSETNTPSTSCDPSEKQSEGSQTGLLPKPSNGARPKDLHISPLVPPPWSHTGPYHPCHPAPIGGPQPGDLCGKTNDSPLVIFDDAVSQVPSEVTSNFIKECNEEFDYATRGFTHPSWNQLGSDGMEQ